MIRKDAQHARAKKLIEGTTNNAVIYIDGKPLVLFRHDSEPQWVKATYDGVEEKYRPDQVLSLIDWLSMEHEGHDVYLKEEKSQ